MILDMDLTATYNPDIPGFRIPDEDRVMKFGKGYFCPIVLGQVIHDRYRIIAFLGWGSYAMVWLAVDQHHENDSVDCPNSPQVVSLKITCGTDKLSEGSPNNEELCLQKLMDGRHEDGVGRRNVIRFFDVFDIPSPNGIHRCLVLEFAGQTMAEMTALEVLPFGDVVYFFRECVEAIEYVHSLGFSHGDLDFDNIVTTVPDLLTASEEEIVSRLALHPRKSGFSTTTTDGSPLPVSVPESIYQPCPLGGLDISRNDLEIKLIDFGESFMGTKSGVHTHPANTPPELIEDGVASPSSDIWALGCIFWQLMFGHSLMSSIANLSPTGTEWSRDPYQGQKMFLSLTREGRKCKLLHLLARRFGPSMEEDNGTISHVLRLLLDTLEPNPADRPSAKDLMSYSIFSLGEAVDDLDGHSDSE